jgi:hypothetical protein
MALLAFAGFIAGEVGFCQSIQAPGSRSVSGSAITTQAPRTHYAPSHFPRRAEIYYQRVWGIDSLTVRAAESGELIRFNYRVLDAAKARQLNDKKAEPSLIDSRAGVQLVVPSLEKVGQLRQSTSPEEGKVYWMAFSNPRRTVKAGDRVSIVIGSFRADNLVVE